MLVGESCSGAGENLPKREDSWLSMSVEVVV